MSQSKPSNPKDAIAVDKLPLHLVSPIVKAYQAIAHYLGNIKYGAWNYRAAGIRASVYKSALERHIDAWWEGEDTDPSDGTPHLANALCCLNIIIEGTHSRNMTDDRPPSRAVELAKIRADFEALMPKLRAKYADKNPRHYTIADTAPPAPGHTDLMVSPETIADFLARTPPIPLDRHARMVAYAEQQKDGGF